MLYIKIIFTIKFLHAHSQYVCNISTKYLKNTVKALGGVDYLKYALLEILQTSYS